jgi:hypothetical protein
VDRSSSFPSAQSLRTKGGYQPKLLFDSTLPKRSRHMRLNLSLDFAHIKNSYFCFPMRRNGVKFQAHEADGTISSSSIAHTMANETHKHITRSGERADINLFVLHIGSVTEAIDVSVAFGTNNFLSLFFLSLSVFEMNWKSRSTEENAVFT